MSSFISFEDKELAMTEFVTPLDEALPPGDAPPQSKPETGDPVADAVSKNPERRARANRQIDPKRDKAPL